MDGGGAFTMFRRAKLWLDGVDGSTAHAAIAAGTLCAQVGLTYAKGHPLCAAVRPPKVTWLVR
jgi:hypothetical protein